MSKISELDNLCGPGKPLRQEPVDARECENLVLSGKRRLLDAQNKALSIESRFDLAYNAAHALSLAALRRMGYRSGNRYIVFQVLQHTAGLGPEVWRVLSRCHDIRNLSEYEGGLDISDRLVDDLIIATQKVADRVSLSGRAKPASVFSWLKRLTARSLRLHTGRVSGSPKPAAPARSSGGYSARRTWPG
jgi:hypothetical protein